MPHLSLLFIHELQKRGFKEYGSSAAGASIQAQFDELHSHQDPEPVFMHACIRGEPGIVATVVYDPRTGSVWIARARHLLDVPPFCLTSLTRKAKQHGSVSIDLQPHNPTITFRRHVRPLLLPPPE